jgi:hypothetical protein
MTAIVTTLWQLAAVDNGFDNGGIVRENVDIVNISAGVSLYSGVLLCLGLLRAVLASIAFVALLVVVLAIILILTIVGGVGWLLLERPWLAIVRNGALGLLFVSGGLLLTVGMARSFWCYTCACYGGPSLSVWVCYP